MRYLTRRQILKINRATVAEHGGNFVPPDNILNVSSLDYVLEIVANEVFGVKRFATIPAVAAAYCFYLVKGHVFSDGNKRTGLAAALIFLDLNGFRLRETPIVGDLSIPRLENESDEVYRFTYQLAAGAFQLETALAWFEQNTVPK